MLEWIEQSVEGRRPSQQPAGHSRGGLRRGVRTRRLDDGIRRRNGRWMRVGVCVEELSGASLSPRVLRESRNDVLSLEDMALERASVDDRLFEAVRLFTGVSPDGQRRRYRLRGAHCLAMEELHDLASLARTVAEFDRLVGCSVRSREEELLP